MVPPLGPFFLSSSGNPSSLVARDPVRPQPPPPAAGWTSRFPSCRPPLFNENLSGIVLRPSPPFPQIVSELEPCRRPPGRRSSVQALARRFFPPPRTKVPLPVLTFFFLVRRCRLDFTSVPVMETFEVFSKKPTLVDNSSLSLDDFFLVPG